MNFRVVKETGPLDGLINLAGGFRWGIEVIAFLVSDEARAVTGALIPVVGRV